MNRRAFFTAFLLLATLVATPVLTQAKVTTPKEQFGFDVGADYQLINYTQLVDYWKKLAQESNRLTLVQIGQTAQNRPLMMVIITSPENHKKLERYKEISKRLAMAEGLTDAEAQALAAEGKAVVWINAGLHGTETANPQAMAELTYQMASAEDAETLRFLNDVILLALVGNPDGMEMVGAWYNREPDPSKRSMANLPQLYHFYIGHDDARDFFMSNMPETEAMNRIQYREWFPQIIYDQHQSGPAGTVLFSGSFRDPFNYNLDPLIPLQLEMIGAAMNTRFAVEGKPGATERSGSSYTTWYNGSMRLTTYYHNALGLLTEIVGNPTPMSIGFIPRLHLPRNDYPYPIAPQPVWHFRQSIEYLITASRGCLDVASRHREQFLFNIYRMGKNSIERGSRDNWTMTPKPIAAVNAAIEKDKPRPTGSGREQGYPLKYWEMLHDPAVRDPRGYIVPSDQPDFLTATKFVNALIKSGVTVHRASQPFQAGGKNYPAGSYVVKAAQAYRPHVRDMFEPQDHPDDIPYPGGPPTPPYDFAGYTMAYQMGIAFDRILDGFDGPFEKIEGLAKAPAGKVTGTGGSGFLLSHQVNDAFKAVNRLLASGEEVYWLKSPIQTAGKSFPAGTIYIPKKGSTVPKLQKLAEEVGLDFEGTATAPRGEAFRLKPVRIGLWDKYGGSIPSGWLRWLFEQYEAPFEVVYPPTLDAGGLAQKYDVLILLDDAVPKREQDLPPGRREFRPEPLDPQTIPAEYRNRIGAVTVEKTIPQLRQFLQDGGTILAIGDSSGLGYYMDVSIANHLVETRPDGGERPLPVEKYYVPGSVLQVRVDNTNPLAYGFPDKVDVLFDNSPVFRIEPQSVLQRVRPVAWFDTDKPLRSGWGFGQGYLKDGVTVIEADVGKGKLFVFGPEITSRCQTHGTYKFLFNGIYYGRAQLTKF